MIRWLTQTAAVSAFTLRTVPKRIGASVATVVGITGVVLVFVGVLSIASGFRATLASTGEPDGVIVLRGGATSEMVSGFQLEDTRIIADAPQVLRGEDGRPVASAELYVVVNQPNKATGTDVNVPLRGVQPEAFAVRPRVEIVEGRAFRFGHNELIVGRGAAGEFAGLEIGSEIRWGDVPWSVVGVFSAGGSVEESELWCDARVLQPAYNRGNTFQSVHARLGSRDDYGGFVDALTDDPRLDVKIARASDYYAEQSQVMTGLIRVIGGLVGALMGFGAIFGALNTMYAAVSTRTREIATLRALGFGAGPVVISVLVEAMVLALIGGVLGALLAFWLFNGFRAATLNFQTFSQVAFAFRVTPPLMVGGVVYAVVMGLVGGLFPAVRAARLPVAVALRES